MIKNEKFLNIAESLKPVLNVEQVYLDGSSRLLNKGDEIVFDFKNHYVGNLDIDISYSGHHPDAPLFFTIKFCETNKELDENEDDYHGWISSSWIQREYVHVDIIPSKVRIERRFAFRFVKIKIIDASSNYSVKIDKLTLNAVSSANDETIKKMDFNDKDMALDNVSIRTLHECMQYVFEDGPKRDRRLWLGDLRLQALANYETYKNYDLVKRCLYLFSGSMLDNGQVASNVFIEPEVECDFQSMYDYALFYINTLWNYYEHTKDLETLKELEPIAYGQYELALNQFDGDAIKDSDKLGWCFIDWNLYLNKQASAQAVFIYALRDLISIEKELNKDTSALENDLNNKVYAARDKFYKDGVIVSGSDNQVSLASQVWMILAKVLNKDEGMKAIELSNENSLSIKPVTPYMMHHYVQALIDMDEKGKAYEIMHGYWDKMIEDGADTFYELFDPMNPDVSPYGGNVINSYCHAWSCTPTYFLRKYYK